MIRIEHGKENKTQKKNEAEGKNSVRAASCAAVSSGISGVSALIFTVILVGLGERIGERFLPVYLVATGASLIAPSILNGLDNFLSAVYSFPGGWISTRFGYKKALLFFNICHQKTPESTIFDMYITLRERNLDVVLIQ